MKQGGWAASSSLATDRLPQRSVLQNPRGGAGADFLVKNQAEARLEQRWEAGGPFEIDLILC